MRSRRVIVFLHFCRKLKTQPLLDLSQVCIQEMLLSDICFMSLLHVGIHLTYDLSANSSEW